MRSLLLVAGRPLLVVEGLLLVGCMVCCLLFACCCAVVRVLFLVVGRGVLLFVV